MAVVSIEEVKARLGSILKASQPGDFLHLFRLVKDLQIAAGMVTELEQPMSALSLFSDIRPRFHLCANESYVLGLLQPSIDCESAITADRDETYVAQVLRHPKQRLDFLKVAECASHGCLCTFILEGNGFDRCAWDDLLEIIDMFPAFSGLTEGLNIDEFSSLYAAAQFNSNFFGWARERS